jgi:hypothetical protein
MALFFAAALLLHAIPSDIGEFSFDIWDWTAPAQDVALFETWVADLKTLDATRLELSVPWNKLEPKPGEFDLTWLRERMAICKRHGIALTLRINSYYANATPSWYDGDRWANPDGAPVPQNPPAFTDEKFWAHYGAMCTRIAEACRGGNVSISPFIGIHGELKWSEWWSYNATSRALWRKAIDERPDWLRDVLPGDAPLPEFPPVPPATHGKPDTEPSSRAWIAFREHCWRDTLERFAAALRAGDPDVRIASPLGESYRMESASMSNLDYWGLSRISAQITHSYDFFWPVQDASWCAEAAVAAFRGITQLPVQFEVDSLENLAKNFHYTDTHLIAITQAALRAGAGLKLANNSYEPELPSQRPLIRELAALWRAKLPAAPYRPDYAALKKDTFLLFFSKWANYSYRENTQWLRDAQFGVYKLFRDLDLPVRIICEDNLEEDLTGYRGIYLAFSPQELMPKSAQAKLSALLLPRIEDMPQIPDVWTDPAPILAEGFTRVQVSHPDCPVAPLDLQHRDTMEGCALHAGGRALAAWAPGKVALGYPIGFLYLRGGAPDEQQRVLLWALTKLSAR